MAKKTKITEKETKQADVIRTLMAEGEFNEAEAKIKGLTKAKRKLRSEEIKQQMQTNKLSHNEYILLNTELKIINDNL